MITIWMKVPCVLIIKKTAYSPADAIMNRLVKKPCIGDKPTFFAMIPNEKETAKYPIPTGILSLIPFLNSIISLLISMHYKNRIVICKSNIYNTSIRKCDRYESNKIWYFFKVLETKTISKVAKDLGFSQSAVSQTIKSLEELETTLFIRQKRGVILSKDGHAYIPYLKSVQASLDNLRTKKQEMKGVDQVTLRIGTFTSVSRHLLPSLMEKFIEMYPNIQFELYQSEYTNIEQQLLEGSLDLGFTCIDAIQRVQYQELYYDEMFALCHKVMC